MAENEQRQTALGLLEFSSIAEGIAALNSILQMIQVELRQGFVLNPGKYLLLLAGSFGSVQTAIDHIRAHDVAVLDIHLLGNPSEQVIAALRAPASAALSSAAAAAAPKAVGLLETATAVSAIVAADIVAKTIFADDLRIAFSARFGGKGMVFFQGETAAVQAGLDAGTQYLLNNGTLLHHTFLARPVAEVIAHIVTEIY